MTTYYNVISQQTKFRTDTEQESFIAEGRIKMLTKSIYIMLSVDAFCKKYFGTLLFIAICHIIFSMTILKRSRV